MVLVALVLLLAEASAWWVIWCCCYSAVVLVALVLLLAESTGLVGDWCCCCVLQWCSSRWCCSSLRHLGLVGDGVLLRSAAVVLVALVLLLAEGVGLVGDRA